jgi:Amino acid permease
MPVLAPELRRVLKIPTVAFIAIGIMIGGGVFVFTGIVFKITGPARPAAYALAVIPEFISMMPLAMLGSAIPTTGASYRYPSRMVSPGVAFVGVWVYAWAFFFGQIPLYALGCAGFARTFVPSVSPTLSAVALVSVFYVVNLLGVRLAAQLQGLLVIILIAALKSENWHLFWPKPGKEKFGIFMRPPIGTHPSGTVRIGDMVDTDLQTETARFNLNSTKNHYYISKHRAEQVVLQFIRRGLPAVSVNPSNPIGPRDIGSQRPSDGSRPMAICD